jgi:glutathione S-transferase
MPLGQVPVLEISNEPLLVQSLAIARFVAKETGMSLFFKENQRSRFKNIHSN